MSYKAIGFDYGGVIYGMPGFIFDQGMIDTLDVSMDIFKQVYFENNNRANIENISWQEVWRDIAKKLDRTEKIDAMEVYLKSCEKRAINNDVINLINDLKDGHYKIGLLSNYQRDLRSQLCSQGIDLLFDVVCVSSEMGVMKPNSKAYQIFCESLGIAPAELIYIDDTPRSLETAEQVGYTPILFENCEKLYMDLKEYGVVFPSKKF